MEMRVKLDGKDVLASVDEHGYLNISSVEQTQDDSELGPYVMVRTNTAGVFAGYLEYREEKEVHLKRARRIWMWEGAASLSQLAQEGTKLPEKCKFPCEVDDIVLTEAVEIINITPKAKKSIQSVPVWSA